ncbi:putative transcription factor C2H2 family [Helianthus annuus]|nr:putative transcription factor C2H2 family [Helianthus annuus]
MDGNGNGNGNRQLEVHYINSGFPYNVNDGFMDFFNGVPHQPAHYAHSGPIHEQENAYWQMNMNSYKYGLPAHGSIPYYDPYEVHNYLPRVDMNRSAWEYPVMMNVTEPASSVDVQQSAENSVSNMQVIPEECSPNDDSASSSPVVWQDDIDPDNMTYEELLDLGEAIGTESRGLSEDLINSLPTTRYKSGGFFLRKKSGERCVICQMRYKRGDKQINLPCKHVYHTECGSKWLSINKTCPICNVEVLGEESNQH